MIKIVLSHAGRRFWCHIKWDSVNISSVEIQQLDYENYLDYLKGRFEFSHESDLILAIDRHVFYLGSPKISAS